MPALPQKISLSLQGIIDPRYTTYSKRICYACDNFDDLVAGFEIGFFCDQADIIAMELNVNPVRKKLSAFQYNSIHVGARINCPPDKRDIDSIMQLSNNLFYEGLIRSVSFHLDMSAYFRYIESIAAPGLSLLWENLGKGSSAGNTYAETVTARRSFKNWHIVFDIAHALEMKLNEQPGLEYYMDNLGCKIRQIHFSLPDNLYTEDQVGADFHTSHSFAHLNIEKARQILSILPSIPGEIIIIEGVVPPGTLGKALVIKEIDFIRSYAS